MKTRFILMAAIAATFTLSASAQSEVQYKWYGFIRNYAHVDTHEMTALTDDLFSYGPKDNDNEYSTWHLSAITSRLGLDVTGYKINNMTATAKIETDFYNGLSGVTGTAVLRLRQAYVSLGWKNAYGNPYSFKVGQAWHPMAADMPDVISLNTGAPFGPFSRTPLMQFDYSMDDFWSFTASAIWQQQYTSAGPEGPSANYMKYSGVPEFYAGLSYITPHTTVKAGVDFLSIKPVQNAPERMNAFTPFLFAQYKEGLFSIKFKTAYAQAGEHMNLNGGYGIAAEGGYTPTRNSSSWISLSYGKSWQWVLFGGFSKNFGTVKPLANPSSFWFSKNSASNMNTMYRVTPTIIRNIGKVQYALEYELTAVQYGDSSKGMNLNSGLYDQGLHWVKNNRVQLMLKFNF